MWRGALSFLAVDLLRYYHKPTADLFYLVFRFMLRQHELDHTSKRLNGATNVLIAATICVIVFPNQPIAPPHQRSLVRCRLRFSLGRPRHGGPDRLGSVHDLSSIRSLLLRTPWL